MTPALEEMTTQDLAQQLVQALAPDQGECPHPAFVLAVRLQSKLVGSRQMGAGETPNGWLVKDEFDADPEAWFYTVHEDQALEYAQEGTPVFSLRSLSLMERPA